MSKSITAGEPGHPPPLDRKPEPKSRKKCPDLIRLLMPVFIDPSEAGAAIHLSANEILNGACLYGDNAKREGLRDALIMADEQGKKTRVAEVIISLHGKSAQGVKRLDEDDLRSGRYGMVRLEQYAVKKDLKMVIDQIIEKAGHAKYPHVSGKDTDEWAALDILLIRTLFDHFPVSAIIVNRRQPYTIGKDPLSVAVLKDDSSIESVKLLYDTTPVYVE